MGVNPHTGLPITDEEKWKFQYAAHSKTVFDVLGTVGGAFAGQYAAKNDFYKSTNTVKSTKNDFSAENPKNGKDWNNYFREKYGADNVFWKNPVNSIDDIISMPSSLTNVNPHDIIELVKQDGWTVTPLKKGNSAGLTYEQGGGYSMNPPAGTSGSSRYIQYHPGGGHHGGLPYYKVSSPEYGIKRIYMNGKVVVE